MASGTDTRPPAVFLMGPTAAGKTALAVALHERFPLDIISVDSAMVYRGMDIGTAKPDAATLARAPHRLIDIRDPAGTYSAGEFREDASRAMTRIREVGRAPLLVGGTMLYFRALSGGLAPLPSADRQVRAQLERDARRLGWAALHERLAGLDPDLAARIHPNDPQRIQRALEVIGITGRPMSELQREHREQAQAEFPWRVLRVVVCPEGRDVLHQRIERRFHQMLDEGLLGEVQGLRERSDLNPDLPSMRSVGYRQAWQHLAGDIGRNEMVRRGIAATRQLAKRQLTWLRREIGAVWYDPRTDAALESVFNEVGAILAEPRP